MRPHAFTAVFDALSVPLYHPVIAGAVIASVQRAVAEQAVHVLFAFMTRIILTVFIGKKCC